MRNNVSHQQDEALRIRSRAPRLVISQLSITDAGALAVVFLASNMVRGTILSRADPGPLPFRHHIIGQCPVFHLVHIFPLPPQPLRFLLIQLPARNPLINPLILIRLALINHRRFCLGKDYSTHHQRHRLTASNNFFIDASLMCKVMLPWP